MVLSTLDKQQKIQTSKKDVEIDRISQKELAKREDQPVYKERMHLDENQIKRLRTEIFAGYERMERERKTNHFYENLDMLDAQYNGEMADDSGLEFNLNIPITQVKTDLLGRLIVKAFIESDPKFTITPRPAFAKKDQWDVIVNRQSDYLDYKFDEEIDIESPLRKVVHQAVLYPVGIMKMSYKYLSKLRKREEFFSGRVEVKEDGKTLWQPGLEAFLKQYPEAVQEGKPGHSQYLDLKARKDVSFKARFHEVVYDDPNPSFVDIRDFFVPYRTEGYIGLCDTQLYIERQAYTWWELKKAEANQDLENVDKCKYPIKEGEGEGSTSEQDNQQNDEADYRQWDYTILEATYWFNEKADSIDPDKSSDDPSSEVRIKCWFDVRSKAFLGAILYPYDAVDSEYIPFYCENKKPGFYKGEFAKKLTSSHLAQNAMLNLMLTETWIQLTTTPIIKQGSPIADQFLNKRWKPGVPLEVPIGSMSVKEEMGFLDKPNNVPGRELIPMLLFLAKMDDDRTGVSSLMTGKESPQDPTAPAAKTAMLLKQSGINVSDYIKSMLPSFNMVATITLLLSYQMSKQSKSYRLRQLQNKVVGGSIFGDISRADMIAKTNIQSRAAGFDFDKVHEKQEALALAQTIMTMFPGIVTPQGIYSLARTLVQSWGPLWKNRADQILPDPRTFQEDQFKMCLKALVLYMQSLKKEAEVTGVEPKPDIKQFLTMASQMMKQAVLPQQQPKAKA